MAVERLGPAAFVGLLAKPGDTPKIIGWHVKAWAAEGLTVPWAALEPLAADASGIDDDLLAILADGDPASRPWLLRVMAGED